MFMWKYFFLYVFLGFLNGFTNPYEVQVKRPINSIFPIVSLIAFGLIIWNFVTFGFSWGLISVGEFFIGYFFGRTLARNIV